VLSAVDAASTVPGNEANPLYNMVRLRRDLGAQSNFGVVYTDRVHGGDFNRVAGADTRILLGRYVIDGQLAASFTNTGGATSHGRPLFDFTLTRTGRDAGFTLVVEGIHPEFHAASGFIPRPGIAHMVLRPRRTFFPRNSVFESITFSPILDGTWDWDRFTAGTEPNDIKVNCSEAGSEPTGCSPTSPTRVPSFLPDTDPACAAASSSSRPNWRGPATASSSN
jgi:hypothetical protein